MAKIRVLVVDDEPAILRFLKPALEANNYMLMTAGTVAESIKRIAADTPDIVVLDLGLPDGELRTRARRLWVAAGYAASAAVAVFLVADRPHVTIGPVIVLAGVDVVIGLAGYLARCRAAGSVHERDAQLGLSYLTSRMLDRSPASVTRGLGRR